MKKNNPIMSLIGRKIVNVVKERYDTFIVLDNGLKLDTWSLEDSIKKFLRQQKRKPAAPKAMNLEDSIKKFLRQQKRKPAAPKAMNLYDYINLVIGRKMTWYSDKRRYTHRLKPQGHISDREFMLLKAAFKKLKMQDGLEVSIGHEELSVYNNNFRYYNENKKARLKETYLEVIVRTNHYPSQIIIEQ